MTRNQTARREQLFETIVIRYSNVKIEWLGHWQHPIILYVILSSCSLDDFNTVYITTNESVIIEIVWVMSQFYARRNTPHSPGFPHTAS